LAIGREIKKIYKKWQSSHFKVFHYLFLKVTGLPCYKIKKTLFFSFWKASCALENGYSPHHMPRSASKNEFFSFSAPDDVALVTRKLNR